MKFYSFFLLLLLFNITSVVFAQNIETTEDNLNTLENQFQDMKSSSNNYQIYKVVKETSLNEFWNSVEDTLNADISQISSLQTEVSKLNSEVENLKNQVSERDSSLEDQEYQIEHMSFLSIGLTKGTYVTLTWVLIFILLITAIVLYFRFISANKVTVNTRNEHSLLHDEFESHKKRSRENESKIKRELQTEINTVQELRQKLGEP